MLGVYLSNILTGRDPDILETLIIEPEVYIYIYIILNVGKYMGGNKYFLKSISRLL